MLYNVRRNQFTTVLVLPTTYLTHLYLTSLILLLGLFNDVFNVVIYHRMVG